MAARKVQQLVPDGSSECYSIGIVADKDENRHLLLSTSRRGGNILPTVQAWINAQDEKIEVASHPGQADAEVRSIRHLERRLRTDPQARAAQLRITAIAAGKLICPPCEDEMLAKGIAPASRTWREWQRMQGGHSPPPSGPDPRASRAEQETRNWHDRRKQGPKR